MGSLTALLGRSPRVAILEAFAENPDEEFSVPELVAETSVAKRSVYKHIRLLKADGIVKVFRKEGKCLFYKLNENDRRSEVLPFLESLATMGKIEGELKRDFGIAPELPLFEAVKSEGLLLIDTGDWAWESYDLSQPGEDDRTLVANPPSPGRVRPSVSLERTLGDRPTAAAT